MQIGYGFSRHRAVSEMVLSAYTLDYSVRMSSIGSYFAEEAAVHISLPRTSAVIAAAVAVSASALIGTAQPAFAYNACSKTYAADPYQQTWVSVTSAPLTRL